MRLRTVVAVAAVVLLGVAMAVVWRVSDTRQIPTYDKVVERPGHPQPPVASVDGGLPSVDEPAQDGLPRVWRAVDERAVDALPVYEDGWSEAGRALVDVSGAVYAAETWKVGDRMAVELPQLGETYQSIVERIDRRAYVHSVRGLIIDRDGRERRVVVTVGPGRVFAYVDTWAGPYELVANDRLGWLLPSSSMMAGIDYSNPDYLLRERVQGEDDAD